MIDDNDYDDNDYIATTPYGIVTIRFGEDDDNGTYYYGYDLAILALKRHISSCYGHGGISFEPNTVDPIDLLDFCQSEDFVILPNWK